MPLGQAESVAEAQGEPDTVVVCETVAVTEWVMLDDVQAVGVEDTEREPVAVEHRVSESVGERVCEGLLDGVRDCVPEEHAVGVKEAQGEPDSVSEALGEVEADAQALPDGEADFEHIPKDIIINKNKIECIVFFPTIRKKKETLPGGLAWHSALWSWVDAPSLLKWSL